jgi:serine/threonine-protein kinase
VTPPTGPNPIVIGRYEVLRELGRGAMGIVYEARDPALSRTIALKTILPAPFGGNDETFEERFFSEARIAARLSRPGIVVVHDVGRDPETGVLYIALEHLRGRTLATVVDNGPLEWREVCRLTAQVARALAHAHAQGVIHRDLKPANVMVLASGETKIMDFGIARIETARFRLTNPGEFVGTPLYAAPEQAARGDTDTRTDIFSLGSIAYTLLTGRPAFAAERIPEIVHRMLTYDPPAPSRIVPGIPEDLDRVVARAMAKDPEHRYPDAIALALDLEAVSLGRVPAQASEEARIAAAKAWTPPEATAGWGGLELVVAPEDTIESALTALVDGTNPPSPPLDAGGTNPATGPSSGARGDRAAAEAATAPPLPGTVPPAGAPRGSRLRPAIVVGVLLGVGFVIGYLALVIWPWGDREPVAGATAPPSSVARSSPPPLRASPSASPTATPAPSAATPHSTRPTAPATTAPATPRTGAASGHLRIDFDHPLKEGALRVFVDGALVLEDKLSGNVKKKGLVFKLAQGNFKDVLSVTPGVHIVRFEVKWDENVKIEEITGRFQPGETRTLEADLGRIRKDLNLEWK